MLSFNLRYGAAHKPPPTALNRRNGALNAITDAWPVTWPDEARVLSTLRCGTVTAPAAAHPQNHRTCRWSAGQERGEYHRAGWPMALARAASCCLPPRPLSTQVHPAGSAGQHTLGSRCDSSFFYDTCAAGAVNPDHARAERQTARWSSSTVRRAGRRRWQRVPREGDGANRAPPRMRARCPRWRPVVPTPIHARRPPA